VSRGWPSGGCRRSKENSRGCDVSVAPGLGSFLQLQNQTLWYCQRRLIDKVMFGGARLLTLTNQALINTDPGRQLYAKANYGGRR
jgi:hypothetical protein